LRAPPTKLSQKPLLPASANLLVPPCTARTASSTAAVSSLLPPAPPFPLPLPSSLCAIVLPALVVSSFAIFVFRKPCCFRLGPCRNSVPHHAARNLVESFAFGAPGVGGGHRHRGDCAPRSGRGFLIGQARPGPRCLGPNVTQRTCGAVACFLSTSTSPHSSQPLIVRLIPLAPGCRTAIATQMQGREPWLPNGHCHADAGPGTTASLWSKGL
jgi:hypothetical protein